MRAWQEPPLAIPALDIVVDELELRGKKMGRVEIEAVNSDNSTLRNAPSREWTLNKLNVTVPEASLKANGRWLTSREGAHLASTEMNFKLDVSDAGELLNRLGTKDALRAGGGKLEGKVSWNGAPLTLHYPSMTGHFNVPSCWACSVCKPCQGACCLIFARSLAPVFLLTPCEAM